MKKILIITLGLLLTAAGITWADQGFSDDMDLQSDEELVSSSPKSLKVKRAEDLKMDSEAKLVDLKAAKANSRIQDLERRVKSLEINDRLMEDRIRQLDRSVDDLKRRR